LRQRVEDNAFHLKSKVTAFARYGAVKDNTFDLYSRKPALQWSWLRSFRVKSVDLFSRFWLKHLLVR
jgi:hypothetical protein